MKNQSIDFRSLFLNPELEVPTLSGKKEKYINFDNAATSPPLRKVIEKINEFAPLYSSIHRGNGFTSLLATEIYEETRKVVGNFVNADLTTNTVIYGKNSTEAINKIANCYPFKKDDIVISSRMEHHSNDLPWRKKTTVKYIEVKENGELDLDHFKYLLAKFRGRVQLVTITGASNVSGSINPIHHMAAWTHKIGAKILVDASQLAPHRKIDMKNDEHPEHLDFIVFTAHKIYAPFGTGVIVGPKNFFNENDPDSLGGGMIKIVTDHSVYFEEAPEKNEAGTPNVIGALALGVSLKLLESISMYTIEKHETMLTQYLLAQLKKIQGIQIYGQSSANTGKRVGVISFSIEGVPHGLVAAILSYEYAIGVRNGCFCAQPYVSRLLKMKERDISMHKKRILKGDKSNQPGLVRISLSMYNTLEEIDRLILALDNITKGNYSSTYILHKESGMYLPKNYKFKYQDIFTF